MVNSFISQIIREKYTINPNSPEVKEMIKNFLRDNRAVRSGLERRQFAYDKHISERRSANDRRNGFDRRLKPRISDYYAWYDQKSNLRFEDDPDNEMPTTCT